MSRGVIGTASDAGGFGFMAGGLFMARSERSSSHVSARISHIHATLILSSWLGSNGGRGSAALGCGVSACTVLWGDSVFNCITSCANGEILFFTP